MKTLTTVLVVVALALVGVCIGRASGTEQGGTERVLSITPIAEGSCVAVAFQIPKDKALAGVRWYNNDAMTVFPRLRFFGGQRGLPVGTTSEVDMGSVEPSVSLGWAEALLTEPIVSSAEVIYVVFDFPTSRQFTTTGENGGPGFGYEREASGPSVFLSGDGREWVRLRSDTRLLVEPVLVTRAAGMMALGEGKARNASGESVFRTELLRPYPNPANPTIRIPFTLERDSDIMLVAYDLRGRRVRCLATGHQSRGLHAEVWDGRDDRGRPVGSGVYFVSLRTEGKSYSRRCLLLR